MSKYSHLYYNRHWWRTTRCTAVVPRAQQSVSSQFSSSSCESYVFFLIFFVLSKILTLADRDGTSNGCAVRPDWLSQAGTFYRQCLWIGSNTHGNYWRKRYLYFYKYLLIYIIVAFFQTMFHLPLVSPYWYTTTCSIEHVIRASSATTTAAINIHTIASSLWNARGLCLADANPGCMLLRPRQPARFVLRLFNGRRSRSPLGCVVFVCLDNMYNIYNMELIWLLPQSAKVPEQIIPVTSYLLSWSVLNAGKCGWCLPQKNTVSLT